MFKYLLSAFKGLNKLKQSTNKSFIIKGQKALYNSKFYTLDKQGYIYSGKKLIDKIKVYY